jgi:Ner family transcriptional regulator
MSTQHSVIASPKKPVQDWHPAFIVAAVWEKGTSLQRLARKHNYCNTALTLALRRPWPKAERIIAEAIGVSPSDIWPSRYHADGSPRSGRGERGLGRGYKAKDTAANGRVNVQNKRAA